MSAVLGLGFVLYLLVAAAFWILRQILRFFIELEEDALKGKQRALVYQAMQRIAVLRALEAITLTIFFAIMPVAAVVLGMTLPAKIRQFFEPYVGPETLVAVTLVALFAYLAVALVWKRHEGKQVRKAIGSLFK